MNTLTIDDKEYAVIPMDDYLSFGNNLADNDDFKQLKLSRQSIENGDEETLPIEFTKQLLFSGKNKIKLWRKYRNLSAKNLADQTRINPSSISLIESGKREPTLAQAKILAEVLGVDIDDLV